MAAPPAYEYSRLESPNSIRLLMIEKVELASRAEEPSDPRCWIRHFSLDNAPPYRALSYAWGDMETKPIYLNDQKVLVRKNLWQALRYIRPINSGEPNSNFSENVTAENTTWIWIDALCIDQQNNSERNHQVRVMGKIYEMAVEVLVWLGCSEDNPDGPTLHRAMKGLSELAEHPNGNKFVCGRIVQKYGLSVFSQLFQLPYWTRMWIVQETCLAKDLILLFDSAFASWTGIQSLRRFLMRSPYQTKFPMPPQISDFEETNQLIKASQAFSLDAHRTQSFRNNLEDLINSTLECICTDPKDKIYGLLGLLDDNQSKEISVDYSKSLFEVFADVMRFYFHLSSYTPGLYTVRFAQLLQKTLGCQQYMENAVQTHMLSSALPKTWELMYAYGQRIGVVEAIGEPFPGSVVLAPQVSSKVASLPPRIFFHEIGGSLVPFTPLERPGDPLKSIPVNGQASFALQDPDHLSTLAQRRPSEIGYGYITDNKQKSDKCLPFIMGKGCLGYDLGYIPISARVGDVICRYAGCDVVVVLRPKQLGYEIIGRALLKYLSLEEGLSFADDDPDKVVFHFDMVALQQLTA